MTEEAGDTRANAERARLAVREASHTRGIDARKKAPRSSHAAWGPAADRADPVTILDAQAADRVADLVPIRYGRMLTSPFGFYRGAAAVMAADLATLSHSGLNVQLCGDAHLTNFGTWASPERNLIFGLNDFDETLPGPFEWDLKRLAASIEVVARELGFGRSARRAIVLAGLRTYQARMASFAAMGELELWYFRIHEAELKRLRRRSTVPLDLLRRVVHRAHAHDQLHATDKLTGLVDGHRQILDQPPLIVRPDTFDEELVRENFAAYLSSIPRERRILLERYQFVDVAKKVVGVGSVGTRCWIALFEGRDEHDPLVLQIKEATASVLEPHLGESEFGNHGERVVVGQRLTQAASDIFLGWMRGSDGRDYYWRQLWDMKSGVEPLSLRARQLRNYSATCGWALARAHAKTGDRVAIAAYIGSNASFADAVADFAAAYASQAEADYRSLQEAEQSGRIEVRHGL